MSIINTVATWLGYTMGTSSSGDDIILYTSAIITIVFVIFIVSMISRILNRFFIGGKNG